MSDDQVENLTQQVSDASNKLKKMSDEEIYKQIDHYFPIKDKDGNPSYRIYQRKSIFNTIKAFQDGVKCVLIDGNVGSGKSVINYTVGRIMGSCVYLTSQKSLQDQLGSEQWPRVKVVKGKNAYGCNYCRNKHSAEISCDYKGKDFNMCNNRDKYVNRMSTSLDEEIIKNYITTTLKRYDKDEVKRRRYSSFEPSENIGLIFSELKQYCENRTLQGYGEVKFPISSLIGCKLSAIECSMRSARIMSKLYDMRILNPDVFFNLTRNQPDYFGHIDVMIVDECHSLESVISRIFSTKIPIDVIKYMTGVDMTQLFETKNPEEFAVSFEILLKNDVGKFLAVAKVLENMKDVTRLHSHTNIGDVKSQSDYSIAIKHARNDVEKTRLTFSILNFVNIAFTNTMDDFLQKNSTYECFRPFMELVRKDYNEQCMKFGIEEKDAVYDVNCLSEIALNHFKDQLSNTYKPVEQVNVIDYVISVAEALDGMIEKLRQMVCFKSGEHRIFVYNIGAENGDKSCAGTEFEPLSKLYQSNISNSRFIEVVPANIASLLHYAFFSYTDHILLSTGTWTDWKGQLATYGISSKDVRYLKIPSIFSPARRPVYILDNDEYTNFSEKNKSGSDERYVYQTDDGRAKWLKELSETVSKTRQFVGDRRDLSPDILNIIIHPNSFSIVRTIAKYGNINENWLFHTGDRDPIINEITGECVTSGGKDYLVDKFLKNQDKGFVLVSPSVTEGINCIDGSCRIQIVIKHPIAYLGDPYVNLKLYGNTSIGMFADKDYLIRNTLTTLVQSYGRSTRSETDWSYTFFTDQQTTKEFKDLLNPRSVEKLSRMNISYLTEAIKYKLDEYGRVVFDWPL